MTVFLSWLYKAIPALISAGYFLRCSLLSFSFILDGSDAMIDRLAGCPVIQEESSMITAVVEFKLPQAITISQAREIFLSTAPKYQGMPGLIRKYYFIAPDGATAGGIYLWQSREDADRLYTGEWKAFVRGKYGSDPVVNYLETPVVVDNVSNEIISAP